MEDDVDHNTAAAIKTMAVSSGQLLPLWCEGPLADDYIVQDAPKISESILKPMRDAREQAISYLPDVASQDSQTIEAP